MACLFEETIFNKRDNTAVNIINWYDLCNLNLFLKINQNKYFSSSLKYSEAILGGGSVSQLFSTRIFSRQT